MSADITRALALDPAQYAASVNRGVAYTKKHDRERAAADFTHAIQLNPQASAAMRLIESRNEAQIESRYGVWFGRRYGAAALISWLRS